MIEHGALHLLRDIRGFFGAFTIEQIIKLLAGEVGSILREGLKGSAAGELSSV